MQVYLLQASDPSKYDLLKKNHLLQKRLVASTQRVAACEGEVRTMVLTLLKVKDNSSEFHNSIVNYISHYHTLFFNSKEYHDN